MNTTGYLPQDKMPLGEAVIYGIQHMLAMFPATALVAVLTGFDIGVTIFAAGAFTLIGLYLTRMRIPLFYGSSFSYIAVLSLTVKNWGVPYAAVGILVSGVLQMIVALGIKKLGMEGLKKIIPTIVAGPAAMVIGFSLLPTAINMSTGTGILNEPSGKWLFVAVVTLTTTIISAIVLRGFLSMIPLIIGAVVGYLVSIPLGLVNFQPVLDAAWFQLPRFTFPAIGDINAWLLSPWVAIMCIPTIPESIAHLFQASLYIDKQAEVLNRPPLQIKFLAWLSLMVDGFIDVLRGLVGAPAGTNYGENLGLMVITRNYASRALLAGSVITLLLAFVGKLMALVGTIPTPVSGGLSLYLFVIIGLQGVALMAGDVPGSFELITEALQALKSGKKEEATGMLLQAAEKLSESANLFDKRQLAVAAVIVGIALGCPGGTVPLLGWPSIATGVFAGLVLNLVFEFVLKEPQTQVVTKPISTD